MSEKADNDVRAGKVCPFLPPIPRINPLTRAVDALNWQVCLGEVCAIYPACSRGNLGVSTGSDRGETR